MERAKRVPHSHSLDGGYGVKPKAKPRNSTNNLPDFQSCSKDRGRDTSRPVPTGWPEAVTRPRLPQNPACRFPALGSSDVDSQYGDSLQLFIGKVQLWSKQRELFLDPLKLLPPDRTVPAPTAQHFVPVMFHSPMNP